MTATIRKGYWDFPWGQAHYRALGAPNSGPAMILLHQSPLSSRNYERLLPELSGSCDPFAVDTPGYGASSHIPESWQVADYAQFVWDCADRIGAEKIVLFGRATGAVFAIEAAMARPKRVHCLILHGMPV